MSKDDKFLEISNYILGKPCIADICILIQHFCIEAWALGNRTIIRRNPSDTELKTYLRIYDVRSNDPEQLPFYNQYTRSQFALRYLHKAVNDLNSRLTYSKRNPRILTQPGYFSQMRNRLRDTGHIQSFQIFVNIFFRDTEP